MIRGAEGWQVAPTGTWVRGTLGWHEDHTAHGRALRVGGAEPCLAPQRDGERLVHSLGEGIRPGWQGREDSSWLPVGQVRSGVPRAAPLHHMKHLTSTHLPVPQPHGQVLLIRPCPMGWHQHWPWPVTEGTEHTPPALPKMPVEAPQDFGGGRAVPMGAGRGFARGEQGWGCRRPSRGELQRCGRYVCGRQAGWGRRRERKRQRQQLL